MKSFSETNYIQMYENAVQVLKSRPNDQVIQYQSVLALLRMGSLAFAQREYARYGLADVRHHEDIMALGGRISKDLFLTTFGPTAREHARDAAEKYLAAYKDSKGFYSGINSATMALAAGMPNEMVQARARSILDELPTPESASKTDFYFIEATRSECFLLLGETSKARTCFKRAIEFDPLNYTAHASTLKQFRLILNIHGTSTEWLEAMAPPAPAHFSGHIWHENDGSYNSAKIREHISHSIQVHDIAFGYGALAAGADILIAESILEEGGELYVILPCDVKKFVSTSVKPFGNKWVSRFNDCLDAAASVAIFENLGPWPDPKINQICGRIAMGFSKMKAHEFEITAKQLLILDETSSATQTSIHAKDWEPIKGSQIIIPVKHKESMWSNPDVVEANVKFTLQPFGSETKLGTFSNPRDAIHHAEICLSEQDFKHLFISMDTRVIKGLPISSKQLPSGLYTDEFTAAYFEWSGLQDIHMNYAGTVDNLDCSNVRLYHFGMTSV